LAGALLFGEKVVRIAQVIFLTFGIPKPSYKHKMYDSRIFRRSVCRKKGWHVHIQAASQEIGDKRNFCIKQLRNLNSFQKFEIKILNFKTYSD
jgi:hypothetical protein